MPPSDDDGTSILGSILQAAKKLPGQTVGGMVDLTNTVMGGYANIVQAIQGQTITREVGEGLVPKPVGGTQQLNDIFGISNKSSGLVEDSTGAILNALNPAAVATKVGLAGKALIVGALTKGATAAEVETARLADQAGMAAARNEFNNSGVYIGPLDKKPRAVIDDSQSQINPAALIPISPDMNSVQYHVALQKSSDGSRFSPPNLDDILGHPELFDIYPELKDVSVFTNPNLPIGNATTYNGPAGARIEMGPQKSLEDFHTTLLHETQHVIQKLEGFSSGASPRAFLPSPDFYDAFARVQKQAGDVKAAITQKFGITSEDLPMLIDNPSLLSKAVTNDPDFQLYVKLRKAQAAGIVTERNAVNQYKAVAGEAEARSVESAFIIAKNKNLPTDYFYPLDLYDTGPSNLIPSPYDPKILTNPGTKP